MLAIAGTLGLSRGLARRLGPSGAGAGARCSSATGAGCTSTPENLERAERWFDLHGRAAVFLGRLTPVVRSFISIPAGTLESPLGPYTLLTLAGSAIWCFGFAAVGWALGSSYESVHHAFRYVDVLAVAAVVAALAAVLVHRRRRVRR